MSESQEEIIYDCPYPLKEQLIINDRVIKEVNISSHVKKHEEHGITKKLVIDLVKLLKGYFPPDGPQPKDKRFFKAYFINYNEENYKLV